MKEMSATELLLVEGMVDLLGEIRSQQQDLLDQVDVLEMEQRLGVISRSQFRADREACMRKFNELDDIAVKAKGSGGRY